MRGQWAFINYVDKQGQWVAQMSTILHKLILFNELVDEGGRGSKSSKSCQRSLWIPPTQNTEKFNQNNIVKYLKRRILHFYPFFVGKFFCYSKIKTSFTHSNNFSVNLMVAHVMFSCIQWIRSSMTFHIRISWYYEWDGNDSIINQWLDNYVKGWEKWHFNLVQKLAWPDYFFYSLFFISFSLILPLDEFFYVAKSFQI